MVARSLIQKWKLLATKGAEAAVGSNGAVVPVGDLRAAQARIKELERALGRATMENEILRAARDEVKRRPRWCGVSEKRPEEPSR